MSSQPNDLADAIRTIATLSRPGQSPERLRVSAYKAWVEGGCQGDAPPRPSLRDFTAALREER